MTITTLPIKKDIDGTITIPVTFINPKNGKSMTVPTLPDTGFTFTALDSTAARKLGLDLEKGTKSYGDYYSHQLQIKVGNLTPITSMVNIASGKMNVTLNILGIVDMHKFYRVKFSNTSVTFEDKPPVIAKKALLARMEMSPSAAYWRNRM